MILSDDFAASYHSRLSCCRGGRHPIHVNVMNTDPGNHNPEDPVSGFAGIPRNMAGIASVMKKGGYRTHMVGKWDVGMVCTS